MKRQNENGVKIPYNLSPRIQWLRDYYFKGTDRAWNNEWIAFTTGTKWDEIFDETSFYIVPEVYSFFNTFEKVFPLSAYTIKPPKDFFTRSIAERRAWFVKEAMTKHVPVEILPGDLIVEADISISTLPCV